MSLRLPRPLPPQFIYQHLAVVLSVCLQLTSVLSELFAAPLANRFVCVCCHVFFSMLARLLVRTCHVHLRLRLLALCHLQTGLAGLVRLSAFFFLLFLSISLFLWLHWDRHRTRDADHDTRISQNPLHHLWHRCRYGLAGPTSISTPLKCGCGCVVSFYLSPPLCS
jgi:hypothetical protein